MAENGHLDHLSIATIRTLAMDAIQQANSGHPGTPMGMAPVAYTLWQRFLRFDPPNPIWLNRDRFVLSAAIANARLAYHDFKIIFGSERFAALKAKGARVQRPLWASTGTKNPAYRDVVYIEELVGVDTVNTVPPATPKAFLDHGCVRPNSLEEEVPGAYQSMARLEALDISMAAVTAELEAEGVKSFDSAWWALMDAMETSRRAVVGD